MPSLLKRKKRNSLIELVIINNDTNIVLIILESQSALSCTNKRKKKKKVSSLCSNLQQNSLNLLLYPFRDNFAVLHRENSSMKHSQCKKKSRHLSEENFWEPLWPCNPAHRIFPNAKSTTYCPCKYEHLSIYSEKLISGLTLITCPHFFTLIPPNPFTSDFCPLFSDKDIKWNFKHINLCI